MRPGLRSAPSSDAGFTLVELLVTVALMFVVGGLGLFALQSYTRAQEHQGTADELVSTLRTVAERALSEGRTYCVSLDPAADEWTVWQARCSTAGGTAVDGGRDTQGSVQLSSPSFSLNATTQPCPQAGSCVYFLPRGTGTPGSVQVVRDGAAIAVSIEGLTSRVSRS